jgi:hypothetical protein
MSLNTVLRHGAATPPRRRAGDELAAPDAKCHLIPPAGRGGTGANDSTVVAGIPQGNDLALGRVIRFLALTVIASLYRCLKSYVAVAAISLSSPERNARSTAVVNSWFIRSSCSVE